jgi:uncharacterized protein YlxW (UPF0749 family)
MVVAIVLITTIGRVMRARYGDPGRDRRSRRNDALEGSRETEAEAARLRAEVTRLNDRLQVLERLATDPAKRLSDEIESLKDPRTL